MDITEAISRRVCISGRRGNLYGDHGYNTYTAKKVGKRESISKIRSATMQSTHYISSSLVGEIDEHTIGRFLWKCQHSEEQKTLCYTQWRMKPARRVVSNRECPLREVSL